MATDTSTRRNEMGGRRRAASPSSVAALARLTSDGNGRGVAREQVSDIQRVRILAAMVKEVSVRGAANVTVAHVVARSGVSRRTFYELFEDREDCLLGALEDAIDRVAREVVPAYEHAADWREGVRAALIELLSVFDSEPSLARLLLVESLGAGPRALERRRVVLGYLIGAVEEGRKDFGKMTPHAEPASLTAEGVVGAVLAVLHGRVLEGTSGKLVELVNPLMAMIVLPYLGVAAARRERERTVPKATVRPPVSTGDPLRELQMRLTYRTVRVLLAVAANPGSSNRVVGNGAGIADQGQISKLLGRLYGLGLIENAGAPAARGGPNAWTLTNTGWEVHTTITHNNN